MFLNDRPNSKTKKDGAERCFKECFTVINVNKPLGKGSFATVCAGTEIDTNKVVAVKIVDKTKLTEVNIKRVLGEIRIMSYITEQRLKNCIRLIAHFEEGNQIYIVMDRAKGTLADDKLLYEKRMTAKGMKKQAKKNTLHPHDVEKFLLFSESKMKQIMFQLVSTLKCLYEEHDIIHRDLKPTNILMTDDDHIKLTDFNLSEKLDDSKVKVWTSSVGTLAYAAPEVIKGQPYKANCDVWSLGVILYQLLSNGFFPYECPKDFKDYKDVPPAKFKHYLISTYNGYIPKWQPDFIWQFVSADAKDLLSRILKPSPLSRCSYEDILKHRWFESLKLGASQRKPKFKPAGSYMSSLASGSLFDDYKEDEGKVDSQLNRSLNESCGTMLSEMGGSSVFRLESDGGLTEGSNSPKSKSPKKAKLKRDMLAIGAKWPNENNLSLLLNEKEKNEMEASDKKKSSLNTSQKEWIKGNFDMLESDMTVNTKFTAQLSSGSEVKKVENSFREKSCKEGAFCWVEEI